MTLSPRDKKIVTFLIPIVVVLGYWFLLLTPERQAASDAAATLESEQARLAEAESQASTVQAAKANFARDYAAVVALGKAIPTSVDMPSLLVQLEQAAQGTGIELDGVEVGERTTAADPAASATPTVPGAPDPAAATGEPQSAPGAAVASAENAAAAATTPPPTADAAGATTPAATGTTAAMPAAGALESVSLEFDFTGDFFELADFFHSLKRFVYVAGDNVRVRGRLLTIDGVEYMTDAENFPALTATVSATVYLTPKAEGITAGASPAGPPATPSAATPVSTASDGSTSPTPTATVTP